MEFALHQIAQWYNMGSAKVPPITMEAMQQNMAWDGSFHVATLVLTIIGVYLLLSHSSSLSLLIIACSTCALHAQVPPSAAESQATPDFWPLPAEVTRHK